MRKQYLGNGRWALPRVPIEHPKRAPIPKLKKIKPKIAPKKKKPATRRKKVAKAVTVTTPKKQLPKKKRGWFW